MNDFPHNPGAPGRSGALPDRPPSRTAGKEAADGDKGRRSSGALGPLLTLKPYLARYRAMVLATVAALLVAAIATLAVPLGVRRVIDFGFSGARPEIVDTYFAMMIVIGLLLALASSARFFCVNWLGERVVADLRRDVFEKLTTLSATFYERTHSGEVMSRLTADTTQIKTAIGVAFSQSLRNLVLFVGALIMMFVTSASLSLLVLVAIPVIVLPLVAYGRVVRRLSRTAQDTLATSSAYASENLTGIRTLQAFTNERHVVARFARATTEAFQSAVARLKARAGLTAIAIFLVFASIVAILWYGASLVLAGEMTAGRLSQFVLYAVFAAGAMGELSEVWGEIQQAAGSAERLTEILALEPEVKSPAQPLALASPARGEVKFTHVSFHYPSRPDDAALEDVSFRAAPGETVAIVGPSGAGKSTIFSLILRFYDPDVGSVQVDGVSVKDADLAELRSRIAYVPQDVVVFADTIAENIRYGRPDASREQVEAVAKAAFADPFIRGLTSGYDTVLGERGVTLSGGQRQRIAIARAILRNAPILLLDEATSALDAESERLVQEALKVAMDGRTTLVIAHRLATVQGADRILFLDRGRIIEEGTHAELSAREGAYARLARLQFSGEAAGIID